MTFKDPVARFVEVCKAMHVIDDKGLAALDERLEKAFNEAYEYAQASPLPGGRRRRARPVGRRRLLGERGAARRRHRMTASTVESGAAGHGAEPRGKAHRAGRGDVPGRDRRGALGGDGARRARLHARRGHRGLRRRVQGDRGVHRQVRLGTGDGHADRRGHDRRHGHRRRHGGVPAGRRVPVRRLHVERVRRDHDHAGALPLPNRRAAAGRAARPVGRRRARLELPLDQPRAVVRAGARAEGDLPRVPIRCEGPAEVRDPRRQPLRVPGAQVDLPADPGKGVRGPGLPRAHRQGGRQAGRAPTCRS